MTTRTIGVIGLGLLGRALAERLRAAGWAVYGYDLDPRRREELVRIGGTALDSGRAVTLACGRIVLSLPTSDVVRAVVAEMGELRPGLCIIDTTTGEPDETAALGAALHERGVSYLDATVVGSSAEARLGNVVVLAGGKREEAEACEDVFAAFAREWQYIGPWGSGARMKLVVNLVLGLNRAALAEGLTFAERLGLDPATALAALKAGAAYSRVMDTKGEKMVRGDFTTQARLSQHLKDVRLILAAGERNWATLPLSEVHRQLLERAEAAGYGDADNSAIIRAFGV
jgi:3-hydroxyisobutyrate dehydrogenase-like beta-hydroxyacid dehydrogenase